MLWYQQLDLQNNAATESKKSEYFKG